MHSTMQIEQRVISSEYPPYIIAEISANHNGSIERAFELIKAAKIAGASAVKIQTYTPDTMTIDVDHEDFRLNDGLWEGRTLYDLYAEAHTPYEWHGRLFDYAKKQNITIFSSPFDETAVDLLDSLDAPAYKVASFEIVDLPLIAYIAKRGKPMLMSTGMASMSEIGEAVETARSNGCKEIALFHCISGYPAPIDQMNLGALQQLKKEFGVEVGLSDHSIGNLASIVATALGATVIEKHFTMSRDDGGVDSSFSLEPAELKSLVLDTRNAHSALGNGESMRSAIEDGYKKSRRSLYFVKGLEKGEVITHSHVQRIRPGYGLDPKHLNDVIGRRATQGVARGDRVRLESFE